MSEFKQLTSVIIPVFNGEDFVEEAIRSVLQQREIPLEVLVVDDGSTDRTRSKVLRFGEGVTCLHQENLGPAAARNAGLAAATADFIGFLDADDLWPERRLAAMHDRFADDPALEVLLGHTRTVPLCGDEPIYKDFMSPCILPLFGAALFRRTAFEKVGVLDPSLRMSEDQDWFLRAKESGLAMAVLRDVSLVRRVHAQSMTAGLDWRDSNLTRILKMSLDRRRKSGSQTPEDLPNLSDFAD